MVSLLEELSLSPPTPNIYFDNLGAVLLTANPIFHSKTKHFAYDIHYVHDHVQTYSSPASTCRCSYETCPER